MDPVVRILGYNFLPPENVTAVHWPLPEYTKMRPVNADRRLCRLTVSSLR